MHVTGRLQPFFFALTCDASYLTSMIFVKPAANKKSDEKDSDALADLSAGR
jgi:hypothetical protein